MIGSASSSDSASRKHNYEEYDSPSSDSSNSTVKAEDGNKDAASREIPIQEPKLQRPKSPMRILMVGPSRSGKTYTINDSCCGTREPMTGCTYEATKRITITHVCFEGRSIDLIDTPGFDNVGLSDVEAFVEIADYLLDSKNIQMGITGIIYVHRAGNTVHSRSLLRNFRVLTNVFLGRSGIARLSFLVTPIGTQNIGHKTLLNEMQASSSVFGAAFSLGATSAPYPGRDGFIAIVQSYLSKTPIILPIQLDERYKSHATFVTRVEEELGYYELKSIQSRMNDQNQQLRELYEQKLVSQREEETRIRQQLRQSQLEYSSLRSQLQLQENVEQSQVVQTLKDINRMIEDIGRSLSADLIDKHVQRIFGRDPVRVTALHSRELPALMTLLAHQEGRSSLIACSTGRGMRIEDFLDYSIRNFLCYFLVSRLFRPFHPEIDPLLSKALLASYENIQNREPQAIAGKWRSETFKSLHEAGVTEEEINSHLHTILDHWIGPLIKNVFGRSIPLEDTHIINLRSLIKAAWDWNAILKGEVIMLGDFVQTYYPRTRFDAVLMEEFEASSPNHIPKAILSTLGLGLVCRKAVGKGIPVDEVVVCRAVVATRSLFN